MVGNPRLQQCRGEKCGLVLLVAAALVCGCASMPLDEAATEGQAPAPRLLVLLRPGLTIHAVETARWLGGSRGLQLVLLWQMRSLGAWCAVYELPPERDPRPLAEELARDPRVQIAQPVHSYHLLGAPARDPYAHLQSGLEAVRAERVQQWATGRGVRVALIDTGVDFTHPDLAGRVREAASFVPSGSQGFPTDVHGTALAGVIAAVAGNGEGIHGVAPDAQLVALKACEAAGSGPGRCDSYSLALALDHAITSRARIVNLSLAGPPDRLLAALLDRAVGNELVVVAAAEADDTGGLSFPASHPGVLPVLAADTRLRSIAPHSRSDHPLARLAPGFEILSTAPGGHYDYLSGSSLAAAHVAGIAALLLELDPRLALSEIARRIPPGVLADACTATAGLRDETVECQDDEG